ncbi:hypothetical protein HMPREF0495_01726 [Levilactobacillus brevis ATCC 14869 = DSM 20054]|uniref:Uncharacterized protein n=1 Tax=Levilactobacillus brevis ATCC 14869 = DSM 20054 TaxID=649758 RepID=U2QNL1_LEVBR|nr:hypothetical protein HMPREF0495_01726 [Levilactobacillus brevis ATCC 14869 = DSM 20054]
MSTILLINTYKTLKKVVAKRLMFSESRSMQGDHQRFVKVNSEFGSC